ncbi:serpin family protein [Paenibacillaceae bacterium]|nr:serpin family protein [Paenibacillaceae bacterium]
MKAIHSGRPTWLLSALAAGLSASLLLSGCGAAGGGNNTSISKQHESSKNTGPNANISKDTETRTDKGSASPPTTAAKYNPENYDTRLADAQLAFAFDLYGQISQSSSAAANDFLSPLSIATALAMTANGAGGDTLTAMNKVLHMDGLDTPARNHGNEVLMDLLTHSGKEIEVSIANSLWAKEGLEFNPDFMETNKTFYNAAVDSLDFQDAQAAEQINDWVRQQTRGKIDSIIDHEIDPNTILFLLNAIYFKASWAGAFREDLTAIKPFTNAQATEQQVPMMFKDGKFDYLEEDGFQAVRIPYNGGKMSMLVFLPDANRELDEFLNGLTPKQWNNWLNKFERTSGQLTLPKFKIEYEITLNEALKALGMEQAFDLQNADFTPMIDRGTKVAIKEMRHKTFINVDEKGTEAAAVTSVEMEEQSASSNPFVMEVNRPFFFAIHDQRTSSILFMGAVRQIGE